MRYHDLTHQTFGRLTVLAPTDRPAGVKSRDKFWLCQCECGNIASIAARNLKAGHTQSCGCLQRERAAESSAAIHATHGRSRTPEYRRWSLMIDRCINSNSPAFMRYGGRGVSVCDSWRNSFEAFADDVGAAPSEAHSLDRIDNDGDYEPGNVRWATSEQQSRNRRDRQPVTFQGKTQLLSDWSKDTGICLGTLWSRLYEYGWSVERALTTDPSEYHRRS